jgi:hypothetical protein
MQRYTDWPERLSMFLEKRKDTPLEWGKSDCCLFACDAIEAQNGSDPAHMFRGKYSTMKEAFKLLKEFSGGGVDETATRVCADMGYPEIPIKDATGGDVVLLNVENVHPDAHGFTMGLMVNPITAVAQGKDGLVYIEEPDVRKAWRI